MAYVSLAQTAEARNRGDPKSGAAASAVVAIDPSGQVTVHLCSTPNGQGHATVAAQIVAEHLGLTPDAIDVVTEIDTLTSPWSIASGNYANRFSAVVTGAIDACAKKAADKLIRMAADALEVAAEDIELTEGRARIAGVPESGIVLGRLAAQAHWDASGLPDGVTPGFHETVVISPPSLGRPDAGDRVASSVTYGFVADLVAVEVDPDTGRLRIDKYVSVHDVGPRLNPLIVDGQVHGGFAHGLGAALLEELAYDRDGNFLSGTFADYLCPTAMEMPPLTVGHLATPSPQNPLGAKGMGDGSSMLTPAAIANAVADALDCQEIELPLRPHRLWALAQGHRPAEAAPEAATAPGIAPGPGLLTGEGASDLAATPATVWDMLVDPEVLAAIVPGCETLEETAPGRYRAVVEIGVAGIRGRYEAEIAYREQEEPSRLVLAGTAQGRLGFGEAEGEVRLEPTAIGTRLSYHYRARVGGKVATVGQRMLGSVTEALIRQFFRALARRLAGPSEAGWLVRLWRQLFGKREP
jgi:2-furoyl-CoA dehydrogenase large subunit